MPDVIEGDPGCFVVVDDVAGGRGQDVLDQPRLAGVRT
jgi:hypothetical protein